MGRLSYLAARNFLGRVVNKDGHWAKPLLSYYEEVDERFKLEPIKTVMKLRSSPRLRFIANIVAANTTVLAVLAPTACHLAPKFGGGETLTQEMLRRANEISRPQYVTDNFFQKHFPSDMSVPERCPYELDPDKIAVQSLWRRAVLRDRYEFSRRCAASVPFGMHRTTAADLRMRTGILVGGETLWALSASEADEPALLTSVSSV